MASEILRKHLSNIGKIGGRIGGRAGVGDSKRRTPDQCRKAQLAGVKKKIDARKKAYHEMMKSSELTNPPIHG